MRGLRLNILASTALAVVLGAPGIALAAPAQKSGITVADAVEATLAAASESKTPSKDVAAPSKDAATPSQDAKPAAGLSEAEIEARVPMPESANMPPPSAADVGGPTTGTTVAPATPTPARAAKPTAGSSAQIATAGDVDMHVPVPEPADVAPPSLQDTAPADVAPAAAPTAPASPAAATAPAAGKDQPAAAAPAANAPAPIATGLAAADVPVAEKLRDLVSGKLDRLVDRKKERAAVVAFYTARGFAPLWVENGAASARAKAVIERLKSADLDGLDPHDYPAPDFAALSGQTDALAEADLKLTGTILTFARHASSGRFPALRITNNVDVPQAGVEPADVLAKLADGKDLAKTLDSFDPPQEGFQLLKAKLADLTGRGGSEDSKRIPEGPVLKVGMQDPRVPMVRERLGLGGDASSTYDAKLAEAVKKFQHRMELRPTGTLDTRTVEALNGPPRGRQVDAIIATMERWRWMPRDLGKAYVIINLPDFTLKMMHDGKVLFRTRIVIGKPSMPTPIFSNAIEDIVVNPTWHVPDSIVNHEYLPALAQDPTVLARMGLQVTHDRNGRVAISQPPGAGNALGRMKFNFPNKFNVYLHDTPDKNLFGLERRAFSHGCMRVLNPPAFGEALLSVALPEGHYSAERLTHMFGHGEEWLKFKTLIPVHITYQTAYVDDAGKLVVREDVYGLDSRVLAAIKSTDLRMAEVSPAAEARREHPVHRRVVRQTPPSFQQGGGFFERLFR